MHLWVLIPLGAIAQVAPSQQILIFDHRASRVVQRCTVPAEKIGSSNEPCV